MILELMNQFLDCLFADVIVLLNGRMAQSLDPEANFTATTFVVRSTVLVRMIEGLSCVGVRSFPNFGLSTILCDKVGD